MSFKLGCPDCGSKMRVRNSVGHHQLFRAEYIQCLNPACGATFKGQREITHRLSPSARPNPGIVLPFASPQMLADIQGEHAGKEEQQDWLEQDVFSTSTATS